MFFLARAVPYVSGEELRLACQISRHLAGERAELLAVIAEVEDALEGWRCDPDARPDPVDEPRSLEAWRRRVVAQWQLMAAGRSPDEAANFLIQLVIGAFYTTGPVPPEAAIELFRHIEPPIDARALRDALSRSHEVHRHGDSELGEFLAAVLELELIDG